MNTAQIAILFLTGYSIAITVGFIIKSKHLGKHKALFDVEWIEYPKAPVADGFKTLSEQMLEDIKRRINEDYQICQNKKCVVQFDSNLDKCSACLTKVNKKVQNENINRR